MAWTSRFCIGVAVLLALNFNDPGLRLLFLTCTFVLIEFLNAP
jgi:hypothetical protein